MIRKLLTKECVAWPFTRLSSNFSMVPPVAWYLSPVVKPTPEIPWGCAWSFPDARLSFTVRVMRVCRVPSKWTVSPAPPLAHGTNTSNVTGSFELTCTSARAVLETIRQRAGASSRIPTSFFIVVSLR
jgi:hypothetical protein